MNALSAKQDGVTTETRNGSSILANSMLCDTCEITPRENRGNPPANSALGANPKPPATGTTK